MGQDLVADVLVLNTGNDPDRSTAAAADLDVDIEDTFQALSPGHRGVTLSRCADFRIGDRLDASTTPGWGDQSTPAVVWSGLAGPVHRGTESGWLGVLVPGLPDERRPNAMN